MSGVEKKGIYTRAKEKAKGLGRKITGKKSAPKKKSPPKTKKSVQRKGKKSAPRKQTPAKSKKASIPRINTKQRNKPPAKLKSQKGPSTKEALALPPPPPPPKSKKSPKLPSKTNNDEMPAPRRQKVEIREGNRKVSAGKEYKSKRLSSPPKPPSRVASKAAKPKSSLGRSRRSKPSYD